MVCPPGGEIFTIFVKFYFFVPEKKTKKYKKKLAISQQKQHY